MSTHVQDSAVVYYHKMSGRHYCKACKSADNRKLSRRFVSTTLHMIQSI